FNFKEAFRWYLKARDVYYLAGKEEELRVVEIKIARCFTLLGLKNQAIDLLLELSEQTKERLLVEDYYKINLELTTAYFAYGEYLEGEKCLNQLDQEVVMESGPEVFFRYWQTKAQLQITYHRLSDARETVHFLREKAKKIGNDPYYYELQVLEAQIDAEEGKVLEAYSNIEEAYKFFESTPFERSAFEKKIILSQFVEEPQETIRLIDEYLDRYQPEDIHPLMFNAQRIELQLRSEKITPTEAIEKGERLLLTASSLENKELSAKVRRLLAGLYQSTGDTKKSFKSFEKARKYFLSQNLEYEEAVTFFIYLPALLQLHSAKTLGILGMVGGTSLKDSKLLETLDLTDEIDRIKDIFERYDDPVRAKMAQFFELSFKISMMGYGHDFNNSISEIDAIYQWMIDRGELNYSEMIGQFLDLIKQMR
ncbi:MAG: hypothetical protein KGD64_09575, partial [Candidatus Heimdallarchaeota archaeon]|nr:hypothetical protein [Candidatus Heimdallarchaeota archaeon]